MPDIVKPAENCGRTIGDKPGECWYAGKADPPVDLHFDRCMSQPVFNRTGRTSCAFPNMSNWPSPRKYPRSVVINGHRCRKKRLVKKMLDRMRQPFKNKRFLELYSNNLGHLFCDLHVHMDVGATILGMDYDQLEVNALAAMVEAKKES
jgi:hypothetical protein